MKVRLLVLFLLVAAVAGAGPAACVGGPLSGVLGTQCSIGNMVFDFTSYSINSMTSDVPGGDTIPGTNSAPTAADVLFTPSVDPVFGPGFRLAAPFWSTVAVPGSIVMEVSQVYSNLTFDVAPDVPGAVWLLMTTHANGTSVATNLDSSCTTPLCSSSAMSAATTSLFLASLQATAGIVQGQSVNGTQQWAPFYPNSILIDSFSGGTGIARMYVGEELYADTSHDGTASASMSSADFFFQQTAAAPEPGTFIVLATACIPLLVWRRRHSRQNDQRL